jgi:hypothetical protein
LKASVSTGDYDVRFSAPDKGPCLGLVVLGHEAVDCRLQIDDRVKDPVLQTAAGEFGEEALDGIQPRA